MVVVADRYELLEAIGHGGMARVYTATDRVLGRRVAVKLLRDDIGRDPVLRERFLREARVAAGLAHRHIVRVYDAGVDDETPWIAMELVEGPSLREEMTRRGPYPADEAVRLVADVLDALAAAHAAGVVHRDIKPANVLLAPDGPKLGDFGIAKSLQGGADLTQTNQFMGTPKYTAPEVAMGLPATPQADVYSAGVLLWEMLAGRPPYEHENPLSLAMMHRTDPLPSLAEARPDLSPALVAAVEAGLAKEPAQRPGDAPAYAAVLAAGLRGQGPAMAATQVLPRTPAPPPPPPREQTAVLPPPQGPPAGPPGPPPGGPPPPARRAAPPPRRNRAAGVAVVVILLLLAAAVAFSLLDRTGELLPSEPPATQTPTPAAPTPTPTTEPPATTEPAPAPAPPPPPPAPDPTPTTEPPTTPPAPPPPPPAPPTPTEPSPTPTTEQPVPEIPVPGTEG